MSARATASAAPRVDPSARLADAYLGRYCAVGARTELLETRLGDYSYVAADSVVHYAEVDAFVSIAAQVCINPGQHPTGRASQHHFQYRSARYGLGADDGAFFAWRRGRPVSVGPDAWIGHGAVVMGGVTVGAGAVIGAGAVVTRDVADYTIVAGVPARALRQRFPPEVQAALQRIAWWRWPHAALEAALADFRELTAEQFARRYDPRP